MSDVATFVDGVIASVSPQWAFRRMQYRSLYKQIRNAYQATKSSRYRTTKADNSSGAELTQKSAAELRGYARVAEQNHDIVRGLFQDLCKFVIGPKGITVNPQPKRLDGTIHTELARQIKAVRTEWSRRPDVTKSLSTVA